MTKFNVKRLIMPVVFLVFACAVALFMILSMYTRAYAVSVDGDIWCYVSDTDVVDSAVENVEARVGEILDREYILDRDIVCEEVFVQKEKIEDNTDKLENDLYNVVPDIMDSYALTVNGELIGSGDTKDELNQIVRDVRDQYVNENTIEAVILSYVNIEYKTIPSETESDTDTISKTLTTVTDDEVTYTAGANETIGEIADNADVSVNQVVALNPELTDIIEEASNESEDSDDIDESDSGETGPDKNNEETEITDVQRNDSENTESGPDDSYTISEEYTELADIATDVVLSEGMELTVKPESVLLTVQTVDLEKHEEETEYDTEEVEDDTLPAGETKVTQEGQNGKILVSELVTKRNGTETKRVLDDIETIDESVPEIISVGTKGSDQQTSSDSNIPNNGTTSANNTDTNGTSNTDSNIETISTAADNNNANTDKNTVNNNTGNSIGNNNNNTNTESSTNDTTNNDINGTGTTNTYTYKQNDTTGDTTYDYADTTESEYAGDLRTQIVNYAMQFIGCPYVYAGHGPNVFDCSGFTGFLYNQFGYNIPYTVEGQLTYGISIPYDLSVMEPGDLIFFATTGTGYATHVGMYVGNGQYIHASSTYGQVMLDTVRSPSYRPIVGIRRLIN